MSAFSRVINNGKLFFRNSKKKRKKRKSNKQVKMELMNELDKAKSLYRQKQIKHELDLLNSKNIKQFASKLKNSFDEDWFFKYYKLNEDEIQNKVFMDKYVPDITNDKYKYIIELYGSIHRIPKIMDQDVKKRVFYTSHGYKVFTLDTVEKFESKIELLKQKIALHIQYFTEDKGEA